jgi:drug/metabolite transporter (DMT)-like permease
VTAQDVAPPSARRRLLVTAEGTSSTAFTSADWAILTVTSLIWGASFLFIAEGLEAMEPGVVTALRVGFGCLALTFAPAARRPVDREDWPRLLLLGVVWFAIPMTMFPLAEQWISSSVTGMLNGALPIFSTTLAAVLLGRLPGRFQIAGLAIGFAGAVLISVPSLSGGSGSALGVALVIVAVIAYAVAGNLMVPLQQRYGAIPVIWRSMAVGLVVTLPYGLVGLPDSHFEWSPFVAVLVLGTLGTGVAFVLAGTLMGRVGATRGAIIAYLIPVVAMVLGVVVRDEHVDAIAIGGLALVLAGAWLTSRAGR